MAETRILPEDLRTFVKQLQSIRKDVADDPTRYAGRGINPRKMIRQITFMLDHVNELLVENSPKIKKSLASISRHNEGSYLVPGSCPIEKGD